MDELLEALKESVSEGGVGCLVIDENLENSYEGMDEDIKEKQEEGLLFVVNHDTSHKDILYHVETPLPEDFPLSVSSETRYSHVRT